MKKVIITSFVLSLCIICLKSYGQESTYLSSDKFVNEGVEFHDKGDYEKAVLSYQKVSKCDPNYDLACYEMALSYYYMDKNDLAMSKCKEALSVGYDKAIVYSLMGSILDESGKANEGIEVLTAALKKWPYNQNLLYNLGVCFLNTDRPAEAEEVLVRSILINPYHSRTHLCLAKVNYMMGRIAQAYLGYSMVLLLNPSVNNLGAFEDAISQKPKLKIYDYRFPYPKNYNSQKWDYLKGLLQSELAFNKDYNYEYEYNYTSGRQSLMLLQNLTFEPSDTSIYNRLYARLFADIYHNTGFETYLNYILKNINNANVTKWSEKNKDKLDAFVKWAQNYLDKGKLYGFSYSDELSSKQRYHFSEKGSLGSIGEMSGKNGNIKNGPWLIIGDEGYVSERGIYSNDKSEGEWLVFWPDGTIKNRLNFVNDKLEGVNKTYYSNGAPESSYNTKSGKKEGVFENYSRSGLLTIKNTYSDDLTNGPGIYNNYSEGFKREYTYSKGKLENESTETWFNGNQKLHCFYHNGLSEGEFKTWYSNSSKKSERTYKKDEPVNKYIEYYPNNQKSNEYEYDENGQLKGKVISYDRLGKITSEESEYNNGRLTGTRTEYFPDGKTQLIMTYKNDHLLEIMCFDNKGNELYKAKDADSSIYFKSFYDDGIISMEGLLTNEKRQGKWKFYNPLGIVTSEFNYSGGKLEGGQHTYFSNGQIEKEYACGGNNILGEYKEYYINGHLKMQGNYDTIGVAGKWLYYFKNDTISNIVYYKDGKTVGRAYEFNPDGKIKSEESLNKDGISIRYIGYEADGSILSDLKYEYGSHTFDVYFPNGKVKEKKTIVDNVLNGLHSEYYPNGQLASEGEYSYNLLNGHYRKWDYDGNLTYDLPLTLGLAEGDARWYNDKNLDYEVHYEQNKLQGKATAYYYNGHKSRESIYVDDKRNGNSDYFSPEGILMYRIRYVENTMKAYSYNDKSGNMIPEIPITDTTTKITTYYPDGKVSAIISLYKGLYHGRFVAYYPTGSVLREVLYKSGENEGYDKTYFPDKKLRELINYSSDNRNGLYELYYENGKIQKTGKYVLDEEDGDWKVYNNDGSLKEVLTYRNGVMYDIKKK
jgi:uncharacterized protein